ncbi:MAG: tRNA (adenosine(37)-N6)-threonylcarbamoyltransferase complex ATPase subunit type 1 TsaE, partial [Myxococcales bacterium]|nr:tRNA (adenosine(37)-N6)-threonylcarbamoyltransferase complex ATPase subunit type 1 TsaE [Myxococcales bacterium]
MGFSTLPALAQATARAISAGPEQTRSLAEALGRLIGVGDVIALVGDLGAGKTCFVQGLALGLGCDPTVTVASPTFTIVNCYPGPVLLQHLDLYRLGSGDELEMVGLRDM